MPLHWTTIDTRNAIFCATLPVVPSFVGTMVAIRDAELLRFLKSQNFGSCFVDRCKYAFLLTNTTLSIPFGYASYLLYKIGGGFDYTDTTISLGLYGATVLSGCFLLPLLKKKNIKALAVNTAVFAGLAVATTVSFYTIDKIAAYWTMPFTIWALYCSGLTMKVAFA